MGGLKLSDIENVRDELNEAIDSKDWDKIKELKKSLTIIFPRVFDEPKKFCLVNDVLIKRKNNNNCFYQVQETEMNTLVFKNITKDYAWKNHISPSYLSLCGTANKIVTDYDFKELILNSSSKIKDYIVLDINELRKNYGSR